MLEEFGYLRIFVFFYVNKGMSLKVLVIWRVLVRSYLFGLDYDSVDIYDRDDILFLVFSKESVVVEACKIFEEFVE